MADTGGNQALRAVWDLCLRVLRAALRGTAADSRRRTASRTRPRPGTSTGSGTPTRPRTTTKPGPSSRTATPSRTGPSSRTATPPKAGAPSGRYAGDATGTLKLEYAPFDDDQADPGEIVWAWVPYEEDHARGKDRPVLVVGRRRGLLLALMLTSKDHDRDSADEARFGRRWVDIGSGGWDPQGRPSEVRVDRVLQLDPATVRREGAVLDRRRFDRVAAAVHAARP